MQHSRAWATSPGRSAGPLFGLPPAGVKLDGIPLRPPGEVSAFFKAFGSSLKAKLPVQKVSAQT